MTVEQVHARAFQALAHTCDFVRGQGVGHLAKINLAMPRRMRRQHEYLATPHRRSKIRFAVGRCFTGQVRFAVTTDAADDTSGYPKRTRAAATITMPALPNANALNNLPKSR